MGFKFPYGNEQQLNLNWFIKKFKELLADWQHEQENIDGALDAEIQRAEDALSDVYTARDVTVAAKNDALQAKADALTAAANAAQYWQNAAASANSAATSSLTALQAAQDASDDAAQTSSDRAGVAADKAAVAADKATVASDKATVASDKATVAAYKAAVEQDKADTDDIKDAANAAALRSEGWAVGEQNGTPVASGSPYYENNSKYFKEQAEDVLNSIPADYTALSNDVDELKDDVAELQQQSGGIVKTIENVAVASFDDGLAAPLPNLIVDIEPVQTGSGDPSPTNVRPITGWTGCEVTRTGVNVWDEEWEVGDIDAQGQPSSSSTLIRTKNYNNCKPNAIYYIVKPVGKSIYFKWYGKNKEFLGTVSPDVSTVTIPNNCYYFKFVMGSAYGTTYNHDISINYPSTDTSYHAYSGTTLSVTFPDSAGTVYGGTIDIVSGLLRIINVSVSKVWNEWLPSADEYSNVNRRSFTGIPRAFGYGGYMFGKAISNVTNFQEYANTDRTHFYFYDNTVVNMFLPKDFDESATVQVVYELATPIEIQLTPQEVIALDGANNIWADTGNINILKYLANSKNYIDERDAVIKAIIAKELDTMTADTALTANDFRIVNDTLYRITANIAAGATLTPNTNCIATTVADVLKTLL